MYNVMALIHGYRRTTDFLFRSSRTQLQFSLVTKDTKLLFVTLSLYGNFSNKGIISKASQASGITIRKQYIK